MANELFLSNYLLATYGGCEFACQYCDLHVAMDRPLGETIRVFVDAPRRIADELAHIDAGDTVGLLLTDAYQPAERTHRITRNVLIHLAEFGQPTVILTKSPLIVEDLETIKRLDAIRTFHRAGIPVGVAMLPIIPYVTDSTSHITRTLTRIAEVGADFVVWDHLGIPNERHKERIDDMLSRIGRFPSSYYRDIYGDRPYPGQEYRRKIDAEIIRRADLLGLDVRVPHRIFHRRISPKNEISLLLRHQAFRDATQGREHLAQLHRSLAEEAYRGRFDHVRMMQSPLWSMLQTIMEPPPVPQVY